MKKKKINIAISGSIETDTGQKTQTLIEQISLFKQFNLRILYNKNIKVAEKILENSGLIHKFNLFSKTSCNNSSYENFYTDDIENFINYPEIDIYIISELDTKDAAELVYKCLLNGKKVINLNAVSEVTLGVLFSDLAQKNNTIYSVGAGDEPAATLELINYCEMLGLDVICAGKGKNNPLNIYCNPDNFSSDSSIFVSPHLLASFVDGSKTMLEMSILSNATDIPIDISGMHGPNADVKDLLNVFNINSEGGILTKYPVIDYAIGDIAPGVFVIFSTKLNSIVNELKYLKMGKGPNYLLYKPYHLGNIESLLSIYDILFYKKPTLTVKKGFRTMTVAKAKKDLQKGTKLDMVGGYGFYGYSIDYKEFKKNNYIPIGLVEGSILKENIKKDEIIDFNKIDNYKDNFINQLWEKQLELI